MWAKAKQGAGRRLVSAYSFLLIVVNRVAGVPDLGLMDHTPNRTLRGPITRAD